MSANDKQVGGTHYKVEGEYQHWDVVIRMKWDYLIGNATKYLWRLGKKGGKAKAIEDAKKAIHYIEKKIEVMEAELKDEQSKGKAVDTTVPMSEHFNIEGTYMDKSAQFQCLHCRLRFTGHLEDAAEHLFKFHPEKVK